MSDGGQRGDGGIVSRRSGRHAAPPVGPAASGAGIRDRLVAGLAWLFERRLHVLMVTVSIAIVAMISGAVMLIAFTGESRPDGQLATAVDPDRPTPTGSEVPSTYAPILPTAAPSSSTSPTNPAPQAESEPADPATDTPVEQPAAPVPTQPARTGTIPAEPNQPTDPGEPSAPEQTAVPEETRNPDEPDTTEDCDEHALLLQLILGPRCR